MQVDVQPRFVVGLPRFIVGLDLGTTFSGFSWMQYNPSDVSLADVDIPKTIHRAFGYPGSTSADYPKTATALYYPEDGSAPLWGEPALVEGMAKRKGQHATTSGELLWSLATKMTRGLR